MTAGDVRRLGGRGLSSAFDRSGDRPPLEQWMQELMER
jgi:hypothetical protein